MQLNPGAIVEIKLGTLEEGFYLIGRYKVLNIDDSRGLVLMQFIDVRQEPIDELPEPPAEE